ncbi:uncharacterized protein HD556DRAFT_1425004 [Suillus plorans]|uniref:Uncharacterized protein n=1 Tax=Suillus plorans TaxID=116603 RepID=A0A9P7DAG5_9AGAM|nr:uncharacterized protein HD556DRAFT_1425004 [Suillus plorans]KAG1784967.1 hypothetical protein HD556DRAFT_1425004 [Suillus plorans]
MILSSRVLFDLVMDAALLIAVNETCPRPQILEHLARVERSWKIFQNKVDFIKLLSNKHQSLHSSRVSQHGSSNVVSRRAWWSSRRSSFRYATEIRHRRCQRNHCKASIYPSPRLCFRSLSHRCPFLRRQQARCRGR